MSDDVKLKTKEQVALADEASVKITLDVGPPRFAKVKVTSESGIFKNGQHYDQGDEAVIALASAQGFEAIGEVEILGEVQTETEVNDED